MTLPDAPEAFLDRLKALYREMYELTRPECGGTCWLPYSCCDDLYCRVTVKWAKEHWGVTLEPTGHPKLPLLGEEGCTVEPHLRPICTVHTCEINSLGFKKGDSDWTQRYFQVREQLGSMEMEAEDLGYLPIGEENEGQI